MIKLTNITKRFGKVVAVDNVSIRVNSHSRLAILGPSGCGKTTILRLISGFEKSDAGEIAIDDKIVSTPKYVIPPNQRKVGMIFQDLALWPHMRVKQNIGFGLGSQNLSRKEKEEKIRKVLELVNLHKHIDYYPYQLSGGEKQRVALARTLILEPEILLMDEPLTSLDPLLKDEMQRMIINLQERLNITLIYVTHDQGEAMSMAQTVVVMGMARVEQIGSPQDLYHRPANEFVARFIQR